MKILLENFPGCIIFHPRGAAPDPVDPLSDATVNGNDHLSSDEQSQLYFARFPSARAEYSVA